MKLRCEVKDPDLAAQRRREMSEAATALLWENGLHGMSMRQLARTLSWNPATLYQYVASKEDLICLIGQDFIAEALRALAEAPSRGDPLERTCHLFRAYARVVFRRRRQLKVLHQGMAELKPERRRWLLRELRRVAVPFERALEEVDGHRLLPVDRQLLAWDLVLLADMWVIRGWALEEYREQRDFQAFLDEQVRLLTHGLRSLVIPRPLEAQGTGVAAAPSGARSTTLGG